MTCDRPICRDYCTESYCAEADSIGSFFVYLRSMWLRAKACKVPPWDEPHRYRTMAQVIAEECRK